MHVRKERRRKGTSTVGQSVITKVDDEDEYVDDNETTFTVRPRLTIDQLLDDSDDDNEQHLGRIDDARTMATARTSASTKRRRQQSALWIKEGQGEDPIDLTEPTAARSIYGTLLMIRIERDVHCTLVDRSHQAADRARDGGDEASCAKQTSERALPLGAGRSTDDRRRRRGRPSTARRLR